MEFWSTGTGQNVLSLPLGEGEAVLEDGLLVVKGKMGPPVFWEYTMSLNEEDFVSFFGLAKDPATALFLINSKNRLRVFYRITLASMKFVAMTVAGFLVNYFWPFGRKTRKVIAQQIKSG